MCPATHRLVSGLLAEAGLPSGVLNVETHTPKHAPEVVAALIAHPDVRRVNAAIVADLPHLPFGGVEAWGCGRLGGPAS